MNYEEVASYLCSLGYSATLDEANGFSHLDVLIENNEVQICLRHYCEDELTGLPHFALLNPAEFGHLSHITPLSDESMGAVCVGDSDSISVNFEQPGLAFAESVKRHADLIFKAITDSKWNEQELLREFYSNWIAICDDNKDFVCAASGKQEEIKIFGPVPGHRFGFESKHLGITESASELADFSYIAGQGKQRNQAGVGFVIPLTNLSPAPAKKNEIETWYMKTITENAIPVSYLQRRGRDFWLIFNADTPSGRTWFGMHLTYQGKGKKPMPVKPERLRNWSIVPIRVTIFNKERLMPRSGADLTLDNKSVLIVGTGSVGGEIAYKLGSAGIGRLVLSDPDVYSIDNMYRHVLQDRYFYTNKAFALCLSLDKMYPWLNTTFYTKKLLDFRDPSVLSAFDLIVIAIGSPTHERLFHDYLVENNIQTPVVNTWLEGYGIGGHATLDIPNKKGCLHCAYVDNQTGERGLSSNMNFLEPNQDVTKNHAGCGQLFLPYSAISAAQTALIASNLVVENLLGRLTTSSKVSWKGNDSDVLKHGFSVSHRYVAFDKSLQVLPLYNEECDLCNE